MFFLKKTYNMVGTSLFINTHVLCNVYIMENPNIGKTYDRSVNSTFFQLLTVIDQVLEFFRLILVIGKSYDVLY